MLATNINNVYQSASSDLKPLELVEKTPLNVPEKYIISPEDVEKKLLKLNTRKDMGPDYIPNWILLNSAHLLSDPISSVFNSSIRESLVPDIWKLADVVNLAKATPVKLLDKDLRPISLTPVLSKILESFVVTWMQEAAQHSQTQFGAIKKSSTTFALIKLFHNLSKGLDKTKAYFRMLLSDFSKAFDHIDHHILLESLLKNGIPPLLVSWQQHFLTNRVRRVKIGNAKSDWQKMHGGFPQGTLSGPEDFLHMIDDFSI